MGNYISADEIKGIRDEIVNAVKEVNKDRVICGCPKSFTIEKTSIGEGYSATFFIEPDITELPNIP